MWNTAIMKDKIFDVQNDILELENDILELQKTDNRFLTEISAYIENHKKFHSSISSSSNE